MAPEVPGPSSPSRVPRETSRVPRIISSAATLFRRWNSAMSYQYPPPPSSSPSDMDLSHPGGEVSNHAVPVPVPAPAPAPAPAPSFLRPRDLDQAFEPHTEPFLPMASLKLRRPMSTPNVRPRQPSSNASDPNQHGPAGDRKRNKLGYHRTSVACGHCRRRKIRCVISPTVGESRCINCIRLKKDCSFLPTDQQMSEARPKVPSQDSSGPRTASVSASSSPATADKKSLAVVSGQRHHHQQQQQQQQEQQQYHHHHPSLMRPAAGMPPPPPSMQQRQSTTVENLRPQATIVTSGVASSSRVLSFPNHSLAWMSPEASPGSTTQANDQNEAWKSYAEQSPISPSFPPYTSQAPLSAGWGNADSNGGHGEIAFSSLALGGGGGGGGGGPTTTWPRNASLPSQHAMIPQQGRQLVRKCSAMSEDMYATQMATHHFPNMDAHHTPLCAGAIPHSGYGSWVQAPYSYTRPHDGYQGWMYGENGGH